MFVVLEGIDGCGKTTIIKKLYECYSCLNEHFIEKIQFPYQDNYSYPLIKKYLSGKEQVKSDVIHLLFSINRRIQQDTIKRYLRQDKMILCDRYIHSGIAYSIENGLSYDWCIKVDKDLIQPDIIFFIDTSPEVCESRIKQRATRDITESIDKAKNIRMNYLSLFEERKWIIINGDQDIMKIIAEIKHYIDRIMIKHNKEIFF